MPNIRFSLERNVFSFFVSLCVCSTALADNSALSVSGSLSAQAPIATPPHAPQTFEELADSAFYSLSTAVGVRDADKRELALSLYFWRTAPDVLSVRAYVDGDLVGAKSGTPALVGRGRLAFTKDGKWDALRTLPAESPSGYLLDQEAASRSPELTISIGWVGRPPERISLDFSTLTLSNAPSQVNALIERVN